MSYHLEDPYRYLPKCFPFVDPRRPYSSIYQSNRITQKNREIESQMVQMKQQYMTKINTENQNSEINMLKVRSLANSLNKRTRDPLQEVKCQVYGARSNKQKNLRKQSHNFPGFVRCQDLLSQMRSK